MTMYIVRRCSVSIPIMILRAIYQMKKYSEFTRTDCLSITRYQVEIYLYIDHIYVILMQKCKHIACIASSALTNLGFFFITPVIHLSPYFPRTGNWNKVTRVACCTYRILIYVLNVLITGQGIFVLLVDKNTSST